MQKITPFLWFDGNLEEVMQYYVALFPNSKVLELNRAGSETAPVVSGRFIVAGQELLALNGGPHFKFNEAISLFVDCEDQAEVDSLWSKLTADGGQPGRCGWLKDKFGLSWQIIPKALGRLLGNPATSQRAMQAMMKMSKLDVAELERAAATV